LNGKQAVAAGAGIAVRHNCYGRTKEVGDGGKAGGVESKCLAI